MTVLTASAVLALAASCQSIVSPTTILKIAQTESGLDTAAIHRNVDGSLDRGLMQINSANDQWLGLRDPFDPCQSIAAASRLLADFSRYNSGSPTRSLAYAATVQAVRVEAKAEPPPPPEPLRDALHDSSHLIDLLAHPKTPTEDSNQ